MVSRAVEYWRCLGSLSAAFKPLWVTVVAPAQDPQTLVGPTFHGHRHDDSSLQEFGETRRGQRRAFCEQLLSSLLFEQIRRAKALPVQPHCHMVVLGVAQGGHTIPRAAKPATEQKHGLRIRAWVVGWKRPAECSRVSLSCLRESEREHLPGARQAKMGGNHREGPTGVDHVVYQEDRSGAYPVVFDLEGIP